MKFVFIPFKRKTLTQALVISFAIILLLLLNSTEAISVLNPAEKQAIYKGNESNPIIAFECNVVWGTEYIEPMLDIFKEHNILITFFIGGEWAKDNPDLLKRIAVEGHELGNHGYAHKHHIQLDLEKNRKEIMDTEKVIESTTGIKTTLFAPPYGEYNETTLKAVDSLGYQTIMWSIDTIDWRRDGTDKIIARVMKNPHNGALVLMHPTADTVTALPVIIKKLQADDYSIGTVTDTLKE
ncbi:MAG TPA: polysaccharide deacetylase [Clostridiales bacterium]|nr:polysaccharide deacetylase family protein [Clostridia bacterium]MDD4679930.1 polysaccharide deacetylase family protein [Clostridia bacterium]HCS75761.1 polysaccharide deacetylase [Clostridiales bacterium]